MNRRLRRTNLYLCDGQSGVVVQMVRAGNRQPPITGFPTIEPLFGGIFLPGSSVSQLASGASWTLFNAQIQTLAMSYDERSFFPPAARRGTERRICHAASRLNDSFIRRGALLFCLISVASAQQYIISTVAGATRMPFAGAGGPAVSAPLIEPASVAADSAGNVFVSDDYFHQVFQISASGTIAVYAGNGQPGFSGDNGPAIAAQLNTPGSLAVDAAGNLYISDTGNSCIRKVTPSGTITTFASVGVSGLALDASGNMYVSTGNTIGRLNSNGKVTTIAGTGKAGYGGDGSAAATALLSGPQGLRVDAAGNIYFADEQNQRIRKITPQGNISTVAGNGQAAYAGDGGLAMAAPLDLPEDVALDAAGNLLIADSGNSRVRIVNSTSGVISTVAGGGTSFQDGPASQADLIRPSGLAIDSSGNVIVSLFGGREVRRVVQGSIMTIAGTSPSTSVIDGVAATSATFLDPFGVATDSAGNVYITDSTDQRIREVSPAGIITTFAGTGVFGDTGNGSPASSAEVGGPRGATFDPLGNLYITTAADFQSPANCAEWDDRRRGGQRRSFRRRRQCSFRLSSSIR